jgi:hypothetical protein
MVLRIFFRQIEFGISLMVYMMWMVLPILIPTSMSSKVMVCTWLQSDVDKAIGLFFHECWYYYCC